ncbi:MAG: hypothetical protein HY321_13980 [Armatimonadetes bacterium]|nr:hypothetical protein [Armatimonadota bacterium]
MGLEDWLQSGKWAKGGIPKVGEAAGRALEGVGGAFDKSRRTAKKAADVGKDRVKAAYESSELPARVEGVKDRAEAVRDKASSAAEKTLRFVKEKPATRLARTGVQIKAGLTGFGAGYLFPDINVIFLGKGRWVTESGIPVWAADHLSRVLLRDPPPSALTGEKAEKWNARRELYGTVAAPLLCGFSTGLGVRLVQEAVDVRSLPRTALQVLVGGRESAMERAWMLGNGVWCFTMSKDLLMVSLGRSQSQSLTDTLRKLREEQDQEDDVR